MLNLSVDYWRHRHYDRVLVELKSCIMKKNMGNADRAIRVIVAAIIATLYFMNVITGTLGTVLLVIAGVFLLTSLMSFCPLYMPLGLNTCKSDKTDATS